MYDQSPNFLTFKEPKNRFQGTNSARLCSLAGRYDNPIPTRFLATNRLFKNSSTVCNKEGIYRKRPAPCFTCRLFDTHPFTTTQKMASPIPSLSLRLSFLCMPEVGGRGVEPNHTATKSVVLNIDY
jgi:hypothetical protein